MDPLRNRTITPCCCRSSQRHRQPTVLQNGSTFSKRLTGPHHFPQEDSAAGRQCAGEAQELGKHVSQSQIMRQLDTSQHGSHFGDTRAWGQTRTPDEVALTEQTRGVFCCCFFSCIHSKSRKTMLSAEQVDVRDGSCDKNIVSWFGLKPATIGKVTGPFMKGKDHFTSKFNSMIDSIL